MRKAFISQNIGKETSPYSIQLDVIEACRWGDVYPFKNVVRYNSGASGHLPGESMHFWIWPVVDPNYLELRYTGGSEGTFSWGANDYTKLIVNNGSTLYCSGSQTYPYYCSFNIYLPVSDSIAQTLELGVFLGGESEEFINLGTLCVTLDQNLS